MIDTYQAVAYLRFLPKVNSLAIPLFTTEKSNRLFIPETDDLLVIKCFHEFTNEDFPIENDVPSNSSLTGYSVGECTPIAFILDGKVTFLDGSLSVQAFNIIYADKPSDVVLSIVRSILRRAQANRELSASGLNEFAAQLQELSEAAQNIDLDMRSFYKFEEKFAEISDEAKLALIGRIDPILRRAISRSFQSSDADQMLSLLGQIRRLKIWDVEALRRLLYHFMLEFTSKEKFLEWSANQPKNFTLFLDFMPEGLLAYHEQQPHSGRNGLSTGIDALHHLLDGSVSVGKAQCYFYLSGIIFGTRSLPPQLHAYVGNASASLVTQLEDAVARELSSGGRSHQTFFSRVLLEFRSLRLLRESVTRPAFVDDNLGLSPSTFEYLSSLS